MITLAQILKLGEAIKRHYQNYPESWSAEKFISWQHKAEQLHQQVEKLAHQ